MDAVRVNTKEIIMPLHVFQAADRDHVQRALARKSRKPRHNLSVLNTQPDVHVDPYTGGRLER